MKTSLLLLLQCLCFASASIRSHSSSHGSSVLKDSTREKLRAGKHLNFRERKEVRSAEKAKYHELRAAGADEISNTEESAMLRAYKLRNKKRKGLLRRKQASLAEVLFPGVAPESYTMSEPIYAYVDLVDSRKTPIPYEYYDMPFCEMPLETESRKKRRERKNLGSRLQGHASQVAPMQTMRVKVDQGCTPICLTSLSNKNIKFLKKVIARQYRVQMTLDQLPVLMRLKEHNYAVRGYPVGFKAPPSFQGLTANEYYLFNHLKFTVNYKDDVEGTKITGFDVHPVSIAHEIPSDGGRLVNERSHSIATCSNNHLDNEPGKYLSLQPTSLGMPVVFSYEVKWEESKTEWADRWDVYLVGAPDDDLHYFSIVNSLMIVVFLTGAISTIMVRTLRKDIAVYNEMDALDDGAEESGWKLVHGDVFRPPQFSPMLLSVLIGTGAQIGVAFCIMLVAAMLKLLNPVQKGQTLTAIVVLYVLCGSVAGYFSARMYKFCDAKNWKTNIILTATGLPGALVAIFTVLNIFLSFAGAATAVSFFTLVAVYLLWTCVSTPLVFIGAFIGLKAPLFEVPTKTNQIARVVPPQPWHVAWWYTIPMGGILPFGSVCIELAFIMSALWLHQIYYVMGFLFAVLLILTATCAQVAIVLTYLQLCAENHRWWWLSFMNTASAGAYLFLYSVWFLSARLEMVGFLPVMVYLTYMGMMSICFGLFCGAVGTLTSFWFTRTIYGAVKVD